MSFEWREYLVLANDLYSSCTTFSNEEACLRAATSRSYYAAFCTARNVARDKEGLTLTNTGGDHGIVSRFYKNASDRERKKVGVLLSRLKNYRGNADYVDALPGLLSDTEATLSLSDQVISLLEKIHQTS